MPEEEKSRRLTIVQEKHRAIQLRRNAGLVGAVLEVLVEGYSQATGQWIGRTAENRVLNFVDAGSRDCAPNGHSLAGAYLDVLVTRAGPNSLAGEACLTGDLSV